LINSKILHSELELIDKSVFKICGLELTNIETEAESQEYFAHNFLLNGQNIKFRKAKITPTKVGQFVTIWKRNEKGITEPFDISDKFEFYIIVTRQNEKIELFIFPKTVLYVNKILSDETRDGKRGIRVYPTWILTTNKHRKHNFGRQNILYSTKSNIFKRTRNQPKSKVTRKTIQTDIVESSKPW
jgi:hypothetical protein